MAEGQMTITIDPDVKAKLAFIAQKQRRSMSNMIEWLIDTYEDDEWDDPIFWEKIGYTKKKK